MLKLRDLWISDVEKLVELEAKLLGETFGSEMLANEARNPLAKFIVATYAKQVIGYIGGWVVADDLEIINFVIDPGYWHQGIGQKMFNRLIEDAKTKGAKTICLEVKENNQRAVNFYTLQGLKKVRVRKNYYHDGKDAIVMMKELL